jgi:hypothetical protein
MKTAVANVYEGVNADYGIYLDESGPKLPAIQATTYQPRTMGEKVALCLSEESFDMLAPDPAMTELCTPEVCNFGEDDENMWKLPEGCRFIVLGVPRLYILDKDSGVYSYPVRGEKLAGTNRRTATRLILAMLKPDGEMLLGVDGRPQLFTLKLTSTKTNLVTGDKYDPDFKSLQGMNNALQAHFKKRGVSLTHLVSVGIAATPRKFPSRTSGETSTGIMFTLVTGAKPLPESQQVLMFELLQDAEVLGMIQDPFRIKEAKEEAPQAMTFNPDDIDF